MEMKVCGGSGLEIKIEGEEIVNKFFYVREVFVVMV